MTHVLFLLSCVNKPKFWAFWGMSSMMKLLINIIMRSVKMTAYESPKVWQWKEENSKKSGNRPTAGSVSS